MSPLFDAEVVVTPKPEVADPQGQAIEEAVARLGLAGPGARIVGMRAGKVFRFGVEATDEATGRAAVERLADKLLANPNVELFHVEILGEAART